MESKTNPEKQVVAASAAALHPAERSSFKSLLLINPNHFGNMPNLGFNPVTPMSGNTSYEQLMCVGLNPNADKLEAVVNIKQHTGYEGDACTNGSKEYVRFFVERSGVWHDLGDAAFNAYDMPNSSPLPLSYSVAMDLDEVRKYCSAENLVNIRAILSWNWEPPAGNATWTPPWGNVLDVKVQIAPWQLWKVPLAQLVADKQIKLESDVLSNVDLAQTLQAGPPKSMSYAELKTAYGKTVPGHRFGFNEARKLLKAPLDNRMIAEAKVQPAPKPAPKAAAPFVSESALALGSELGAILAALQDTQGDTTYEQLECAGYNPGTRMLGGVITLKKSGGYSGNLCSPGSTEYVGFWLFYSGAWHSLGSAQVQVHDLPGVSLANPVQYAVLRGVNVPEYLCDKIVGLPLRAILSWETPPTGPGFTPVWGNVLDTNIQPIIGDVIDDNERVRLMRINRVGISGISNVAENVGLGPMIGLADPTGDAQDCNNANDSPFGGPIFVEGDFTIRSDAFFNPTNGQVLPGAKPLRYTVQVEGINPVSAPTLLTNSFGITVFPANPPLGSPSTFVNQQFVNVNGLAAYTYMEGNIQAVNPRTLAVWDAGGLPEGQYRVTVTGYEWNGAAYVPLPTGPQTKDLYIFNGYAHNEIVVGGGIQMFVRPEVHLQITSVIPAGGGAAQPAQDCGDIVGGDTVQGTYSVTDRFFGTLGLVVPQITIGGVPQPMGTLTISGPSSYPAAGTTGTSGTWSLDTTGMTPCGYELILSSWDRALVGDSCLGHYNQIGVGFCLRAAD